MKLKQWRDNLATMSGQCRAHFRKEFYLQTSTVLSILGKLVVGPAVNLMLTGLIYRGVFKAHPELVLAGLTGDSYLNFICVGFLFQSFLGSGYHGFAARLINEWTSKTLSLIWLAPSRHFISFLSLNIVEYCRLAVILLFLLATGLLPLPRGFGQSAMMVVWLGVLLSMGLMLGFFRACVQVLDRGHTDMMDHIYLVALFASCPYVPFGLLPEPFQIICRLNPFFHFLELGKKIGADSPILLSDLAAGSIGPLLVFLGVSVFWHALKVPLRDKSFS